MDKREQTAEQEIRNIAQIFERYSLEIDDSAQHFMENTSYFHELAKRVHHAGYTRQPEIRRLKMENRERVAEELYEFSGRYGSHRGTLWKIAGDKTKEDYLREADFLLGEILPHLGYTRQPEPLALTERETIERERIAKLDAGYSIEPIFDGNYHCAHCGKVFRIADQANFLKHQRECAEPTSIDESAERR